ncbi:hypothetical protein DL95DRAFT_519248 [Leptodontidium sp. 2 PMI_412]|nr:hypothetical protein DL95DRAFT_519248 [Leptodontidium sp. 2 PMI_412]
MPPKEAQQGPTRSHSGHNKDRAKATQDLMGGSPATILPHPKAESFHLVVFGAINPEKDGFIWADWLAFCSYFIRKGITGTFLAVEGFADKYFGVLSRSGKTEIEFGKVGEEGRPILTYTRDAFAGPSQDRWWEEVKEKQLKQEVLNWIRATAKKSKAGDSVFISLESHCHPVDGVRLGTEFLKSFEFSKELDAFPAGVKINAISGACYSGRFMECIKANNQHERYIAAACGRDEVVYGMPQSVSNRCRGSRYEQAWLQSLAKLEIFGDAPEDKLTTTVEEHEAYIRDNIHRQLSQSRAPKQNPVDFVSSPLTLAQVVEDLIVRDKVDVLYDREVTSRRRRIEWPSESERTLNVFKKPTSSSSSSAQATNNTAKSLAKALIEEELTKCNPDAGVPCDVGIFDNALSDNDEDISRVLSALYYRARIQSAIWDVFMMLEQRGFVTLENLRKPLSLHTTSDTCVRLNLLLSTFRGISAERAFENETESHPHPLWEYQSTYEAVDWLAAMIARGCADVGKLFQTIELSQYLGPVNEQAFKAYLKQYPASMLMTCNKNERAAATDDQPAYFGFWLPHGLGDVSEFEMGRKIALGLCHFNKIERVYKAYFNVPDAEILTSEQQATFLDQFPETCESIGLQKYLRNSQQYRKASRTDSA